MRRLIVITAILLGFIFFIVRISEVQEIVETLQKGHVRFILLALAVEILWLINSATSYKAIFLATGINEKIERLFLLSSSANFVNVVAPTAGMGGMAVFISDAQRRGFSTGRVTVAGVLFILFEYIGFICFLILGLVVLFRRDNLSSTELIASGILFTLALIMSSLLYLGFRSEEKFGRVLAWFVRIINKGLQPILHREFLSEERAHEFAHDATLGLSELRHKPAHVALAITLALTSKALLVIILLFTFLAFQVPFSIGTLIAGFSIGYLFFIVSPTPAGVGFVEGALTLALRSLNVPLGAAAVIALAYRGVTFWFPLLIGMLTFRMLSLDKEVKPVA